MSVKKDEAIKDILADYESLANLVLQQLDILESRITNSELHLSEEQLKTISDNEEKLDKWEVKLSDKIVNTIVLYQPLATEIRSLIALYRIVISLERIGDLAISITDFMKAIKNEEVYASLSDYISNMMILSVKMAKNAMLSFINKDMDLAIWTIKNEAVVDELNRKMLKKAISKAKKVEEKKNIMISFINIKEMVSNIERISDHAANIAEASIYAFEGKDIRHHRKRELQEKSKSSNNE
ncbi:MAG TPA: PhoU domain-containing protein [Prolixibacteraceae bacterium]|nr:PhoU domain-containing protein [Prolixibacteraceae bacterium]